MLFPRLALLLAGSLAAIGAAAQPLTCPAAPAGRPCEAFHYHVQLFHPGTRAFAEVYAAPPFATQAACERAREQQVAANQKVAGFFRDVKKQERYQPDRIGSCHCDMTGEKSSATYLSEPQRRAQLRLTEDIRLLVKERLLDEKVPADSDLVRALYLDPPSTPGLATPRLVPLPPAPPATAVAAGDLRVTRTIDTARPAVAAMDLPLAEIGEAAPVPAADAVPPGPAPTPTPVTVTPAPVAPAEPAVEETRVEEPLTTEEGPAGAEPDLDGQEGVPEGEEESAESAAEQFIGYETQRIQNILRASAVITDEDVKTEIFEACMERIQLLSNLRQLIEGAGARSRLAKAAGNARTEEQRLALVSRLFGDGVRPHWAPSDAGDVGFDVDPRVSTEPEGALRDGSGRFSDEQKKEALYLVLARTQPTEDQRMWLITIVEGLLR